MTALPSARQLLSIRITHPGARAALTCVFVVALVAIPGLSSQRIVGLATLSAIYFLVAQSYNFLDGFGGQVALGQAAFFGVAAYITASLSELHGWPIWASGPVAVIGTVLLGGLVSIPAARVRGFYFGILTLGFLTVAQIIMQEWRSQTGGFAGLSNIRSLSTADLVLFGHVLNFRAFYVIVAAFAIVCTWLLANVLRSPYGRSTVLVRENAIAASAMGISPARTRLMAYLLGALLAGVGGVLYAHYSGFISPDNFSIELSISFVVMAVLGGMRTISGPIIGAAIYVFLPDYLQSVGNYQDVIYGGILLLTYLVFPRGLVGLFRVRSPMIHPIIEHRTTSAALTQSANTVVAPREVAVEGTAAEAVGVRACALELHDLALYFGGVKALDGVSLTVFEGALHGLIGPNGSGKSTTLNVVSGYYRPTRGSVRVFGAESHRLPAHALARQGLARTFQHPLIVNELTVLENVLAGAGSAYRHGFASFAVGTRGAWAEEQHCVKRARELLGDFGLAAVAQRRAGELPFGRQRMVELARALMATPRLLLLDEPAAGLTESDMSELSEVLRTIRGTGTTVVIVEHHMDFLLNLVDSCTVLDHGAVIFDGTPQGARASEDVIRAYLGASVANGVV